RRAKRALQGRGGRETGSARLLAASRSHTQAERGGRRAAPQGAALPHRGSTFISSRRSTAAPVGATLLMVCCPRPSTASCFHDSPSPTWLPTLSSHLKR